MQSSLSLLKSFWLPRLFILDSTTKDTDGKRKKPKPSYLIPPELKFYWPNQDFQTHVNPSPSLTSQLPAQRPIHPSLRVYPTPESTPHKPSYIHLEAIDAGCSFSVSASWDEKSRPNSEKPKTGNRRPCISILTHKI